MLEAALHDADPVPEGLERRARRCHGDGVPVDAEEPEVGAGVEERPAWPPPPTVASTTSPVGTAARSSTTSAAITGRC